MVTYGNYTYHGEHFVMYINSESLNHYVVHLKKILLTILILKKKRKSLDFSSVKT